MTQKWRDIKKTALLGTLFFVPELKGPTQFWRFMLQEARIGAVRYKAQAYRRAILRFGWKKIWKKLKKFEKIWKSLKKFSVSKKNCPPGDPPGEPKSLLEAKKSLLEMKIGASDAFWRSMIDV